MPTPPTDADWTLRTLKLYLEASIDTLSETTRLGDEANAQALTAAVAMYEKIAAEREKAMLLARADHHEHSAKADVTLQSRLKEMNGFRDQISAERGEYVRRDTYVAGMAEIDRRLDERLASSIQRFDAIEKAQDIAEGARMQFSRTLAFGLTALGGFLTLIIAIANYLAGHHV